MEDNIFGEVIYSYTRQDALEDGVLIDLNKYIPVNESGYKYPIACTSGVWGIIDKAVKNEKYCNDYNGIIWDILTTSRYATFNRTKTSFMFKTIIRGAGKRQYHIFKMECGPSDDMSPCLTIMLPDED